MDDFPVFTRKVHTDVSYLACARKLLAAPDAIYPQFATHNAQTLASVMTMAGPNFYRGQYEFQCLHGMGEPLYEEVVGRDKLDRPCRVYAPVGSHETLLAYLVRRLLENGANTSFVNRVADASVAVDELVADPVAVARTDPAARRAARKDRPAPRSLRLAAPQLARARLLQRAAPRRARRWARSERAGGAARLSAGRGAGRNGRSRSRNPADHGDVVGFTRFARPDEIAAAIAAAAAAAPGWGAVPPNERAAILRHAADAARGPQRRSRRPHRARGRQDLRQRGRRKCARPSISCAITRPRRSGPSAPASPAPLGVVACISPWNFPLAIFTGQVAAALAAGNAVIAKPAEETPLIAAEAVRVLHEAGVPADALALVPGAGEVGAAIVADPARAGRRLHRLDAGRAADRTRARRPADPHRRRRSR